MSASTRIRRGRSEAALGGARALLSQLPEDDLLGRLGLEDLERELNDEAASEPPLDTGATAALFFGGKPVVGSTGIESGFAGKAIETFQDLVAKVWIDEHRGLGQRGPLPAHNAKLHITEVLRGSFGFVLEEMESSGSLLDTPLKGALSKTITILETFADVNEEPFADTLENTDDRSLSAAKDFFALLAQQEATLRLVTDTSEVEFPTASIARATERADTSETTEEDATLEGVLGGMMPEKHMFELHNVPELGTVAGRVSRDLTDGRLTELLRQYFERPVVAEVRRRKVFRQGELVRETYQLLDLGSKSKPE